MSSLNRVTLIGYTGADPETRYLPNDGSPVASFGLATTDKWTDKSSGEVKERTEWHRVVVYKKLAEIAATYIKRGAQLYIEGHLRTRSWTDKDGITRYTTEVVGNELKMLGKKPATDPLGGESTSDMEPPIDNYDFTRESIPLGA